MVIASKPGTMSSNELRDYIYRLGITQGILARITHYSSGQINAMCRARGPVPETIAIIVRIMELYPDVLLDLVEGIQDDGYHDKFDFVFNDQGNGLASKIKHPTVIFDPSKEAAEESI